MLSGPEHDSANGEIRHILEACKSMARKAKAERPISWHTNPNFRDYIPGRELGDKLVENYLRTSKQ